MTTPSLSNARRTALAAAIALAFGLPTPAGAAAARGSGDGSTIHASAGSLHRPRAGARQARVLADRRRHRRHRFVAADPGPWFGAAGLPAGYASDESPFNVQAEDDDFDTGAFYGCLHNVLTAGGYRPVATCE